MSGKNADREVWSSQWLNGILKGSRKVCILRQSIGNPVPTDIIKIDPQELGSLLQIIRFHSQVQLHSVSVSLRWEWMDQI